MKTHLDLFSGIGGFAIAAQNCGYRTVAFCEKEPYAQQILKEQFGAVLADAAERNGKRDSTERRGQVQTRMGSSPRLHDDIFTLNGADYAGVDLLTGGFPCQPFSVAGKRRGSADDRALWPQMLRVIDEARPAWLIGENVAGIVTMELDNILSDLEAIGYAAWPLVIPACAVDARHRRDRVWIVAHSASVHARTRRSRRSEARIKAAISSNDVSDPKRREGGGLQQRRIQTNSGNGRNGAGQACCWLIEPELGRVAHGIPNRTHRLRGLGNAIVPQVAEEIIRAMTL